MVTVAFESLTPDYTLGVQHPSEFITLVENAGLQVAPFDSVVTCDPERPGRNKCDLHSDVLLHFALPVVHANEASVTVSMWTAGPTGALEMRTRRFTLERRGGEWSVVGREDLLRS